MQAQCPDQTFSGIDSMLPEQSTAENKTSNLVYQAATILAILLLLASF